MALATIYTGSPELLKEITADVQVADVADYVAAYDQIAQALHAGETIAVVVTHTTVAAWFKNMQERYGADRIHIERLTRRSRLQKQWGIEIPEWVSDDLIGRAELLKVDIRAREGQSFDDFLLDVFFSRYMVEPRLPLSRLDDLVHGYDPQQWEENEQRPVLDRVLRNRLQQWEDAARLPAEKLLISWLRESPQKLERELALYKVLAGYPPTVGQRVMGNDYNLLHELELDVGRVEVKETVVAPALDHIRHHLERLQREHEVAEALDTALEQASGYLGIEFEYVQRLLRSGEAPIDQDVVRRVRNLFAPIADRPHLEQALADLYLLISQPEPPTPQRDWNEEQWIQWAIHDYLPYRFWLEEIGQLSEDIVKHADDYAEWLFEHYPAMRLSSTRMIYRALPQLKEQLTGEAPALVLIIDNFNAKFFADFRRYLQDEGFFSQSLDYYVSMLPSCTEVSKKCLVTGEPEPFNGTAYEKPVQETWQHALSGRQVRYLPHIGALRAVRGRDADVYFLNYLPLDMAFHQDEQQTGISHAQQVRSHLRALARDVRSFSERIDAEGDLTVVVVSDHGSTRIPSGADNVIDESFYAKRVENKHHRYATISDHDLDQLPDNAQHQCYIFPRKKFDLETNYLAAKRHYHFRPTSESVYVHGGLTPEETLVPVAVFEPVRATPKPLTVRLLQTEFRYGVKAEIPLEIINTNAYPCQSVHLEVRTPGADFPAIEIGDLGAMSEHPVSLEGRFRSSQGNIEKLNLLVTYNFLGEPQRQEDVARIEMKSMMERTFDLDELL